MNPGFFWQDVSIGSERVMSDDVTRLLAGRGEAAA